MSLLPLISCNTSGWPDGPRWQQESDMMRNTRIDMMKRTMVVGALALLLSWPLLWVGGAHLGWFVLGMVVIDLGLQCLNITNQATVAQLLPAARSRMKASVSRRLTRSGIETVSPR